MLHDTARAETKAYCNCLALEQGLDPIGHAGTFDDALVIETPLPWRRDLMQTAGALPQALIDLLALWRDAYRAGAGYPHLPLVVAPDPAYAQDGLRRVILYTRPAGAFARFDKVEYCVPDEQLGALVWALYQDRAALAQFDRWRVPDVDSVRDLLVCTHGTVDAACAKFGYPLYRYLRDAYGRPATGVRVWRVSHFGGHVFAPTFMDMPTGHYWAYVEPRQAAQIVERTGSTAALRPHYRGWAGAAAGFAQAAEGSLWQAHGWCWFDYPKSADIVQATSDAATVHVRWRVPGEDADHNADVRVAVTRTIDTPHTTGTPDTAAYAQYHAG